MTNTEPNIGVAISGGGHRASLFGLGALLYLIDADKGSQLGSVASVSGGSLTNAFFGTTTDLATITPEAMWEQARVFAHQIARRGTLWAAPLTYAYLFVIALLVAAAIVVSCLCPWWVTVAAWIIALGLAGWLSQQRSAVVASAFDTTLLHRAVLTSMNGNVSHVLCATDLQMGQNVFFSDAFVYSWRSGWGTPGDMRVAQAAQASAALPGAFSVVSLPLRRFGLPESRVAERHPPRTFKLLDGGVYDNMGSEWILNIDQRMSDGTPPASLRTVDEAVVVNASAGDDVIDRPQGEGPICRRDLQPSGRKRRNVPPNHSRAPTTTECSIPDSSGSAFDPSGRTSSRRCAAGHHNSNQSQPLRAPRNLPQPQRQLCGPS
jgi:hypothetical protein